MKVLLIEDDPGIAKGLAINLELEGFSFLHADTLNKGLTFFSHGNFNLVILDLGLPDGSGFTFLESIRNQKNDTPVIILTAQTDEDSVVKGLEIGANDYMKKPFSNRELIARMKAVLRKPNSSIEEKKIQFESLTILIDQRRVWAGDNPIELNRREFDILIYFIERIDKIVTRESLLNLFDKEGEIFDRTIDSHISHLRSKLKKINGITFKISSVYGVGYRLEKY